MKIFVQSAGETSDFDYSWCSNTKDLLPEMILNLISTNSYSALFMLQSDFYSLALTSLQSVKKNRIDFSGTRIRNSIVWIGERSDSNYLLSILNLYLFQKNSLDEIIDEFINNDNREGSGYNADFDALTNLEILNFMDNCQCPNTYESLGDYFLAPDKPEFRKEFFEKLRLLVSRETEGLLFLLRQFEDEDFFLRCKARLGLSRLIENKTINKFQTNMPKDQEKNNNDFIFGAQELIKEKLSEGIEKVKNLDVKETISEGFDRIKNSEIIKSAKKRFEKRLGSIKKK